MKAKDKLAEIDAYLNSIANEARPIQADEFTMKTMQQRLGHSIPRRTLEDRMARDLADGKITFRWLNVGGRKTKVYSMVK